MKDIKRGLVVWVELDGDGSEQKGKRPCVIVQNNKGNKYSRTTIVIPLTTKNKRNGTLPTHVFINGQELGNNFKDSVAMAEQVRVVDMTKIKEIVVQLSKDTIKQIDRSVAVSLGINTA